MGAVPLNFSTTIVMLVVAFMVGMHSNSKVKGQPETTVVTSTCGSNDIGKEWGERVNAAIKRVVDQAAPDRFHFSEEITGADSGSGPIYSRADCRQDLTPDDCTVCLDSAWVTISKCYGDNEGEATLKDCSIRYKDTYFFSDPVPAV